MRLAVLAALLICGGDGNAEALRFCDQQVAHSAAQQDKLLRFAAIVKNELENSGQHLALISRSGLDLQRFGHRYSHAGVSLQASPQTPWAVRQLYYACDERKPRLYDQGLAGFVLGTVEPALGYISIILLPTPQAQTLQRTALDQRRALQLLGSSYSANAYAFGLTHQNCNQWLIELLASAWGGLEGDADPRVQAQAWLKDQGYVPSTMAVNSNTLMWLAHWIPWLQNDDHPTADIEQQVYRVSMPASIENFVRTTVPGARRIELCHNERQVVIKRGWELIDEGCLAGPLDAVIVLQ